MSAPRAIAQARRERIGAGQAHPRPSPSAARGAPYWTAGRPAGSPLRGARSASAACRKSPVCRRREPGRACGEPRGAVLDGARQGHPAPSRGLEPEAGERRFPRSAPGSARSPPRHPAGAPAEPRPPGSSLLPARSGSLPAGLGKPQGPGPGRPWTTPAGVGGLEGAPWAAPTAPAPTAPVPQRWAAALYRPAVRRLADSRWPYMHARGVSSAAGSAGWSRAPRAARTCLSAVTTDSMTSTAGRPVAGSKVGMHSSRCHAPCPSPANPAPAQRLQPPLAPASPPLAPGPAPSSAGSRRSCRNKVHGAKLALSRAVNGRESSSGPRRQWDLNSPWAQPPPCPAAAFGTRARSAGPPAASIPGAGSDAVRKTCGAGWPLQPRTDQPYRSSARAGVVRRGCHGVRREASQQDVGRDVTEHEHARCLRAPSGAAVALRLTRRSWGIWARTAAASSCAHVARQSRIVSAGPPLPRAR